MLHLLGNDWVLILPPPTIALQAAMVVVSTVPILCIYPFVQRYFVKGALVGAVKG